MTIEHISLSIRNQLLSLSRLRKEDFNQLLELFARERFLYRLSQSNYRDDYILKGATVFQVWNGDPHRPTKDIDLLGTGSNKVEDVKQRFQEICALSFSDGVEFKDIEGKTLQAGQKYQGVRLNIEGQLNTAQFFLQVDISYGHIVTPAAQTYLMPVLLDMPKPCLKLYPLETVIAEKLEAMVSQGLRNSRLKD